MRIEAEKTAAILIDYQEKLLHVMHEKEELMEHSGILIQGLRVLEIPMTVTQQYTKGLGDTHESLMKAAGLTEYREKIAFSAMDVIREDIQDKKFIILCGIEAHNKEMAVERAKQEGAIITTYESLLFELLKEA